MSNQYFLRITLAHDDGQESSRPPCWKYLWQVYYLRPLFNSIRISPWSKISVPSLRWQPRTNQRPFCQCSARPQQSPPHYLAGIRWTAFSPKYSHLHFCTTLNIPPARCCHPMYPTPNILGAKSPSPLRSHFNTTAMLLIPLTTHNGLTSYGSLLLHPRTSCSLLSGTCH